MNVDNKISFITGYIFTAITTISIVGILQAALVGFIGGFFGLLGKEIFYIVKRYINNFKDE
jgi:ABC-type microcin C transport system permease subunit YejE